MAPYDSLIADIAKADSSQSREIFERVHAEVGDEPARIAQVLDGVRGVFRRSEAFALIEAITGPIADNVPVVVLLHTHLGDIATGLFNLMYACDLKNKPAVILMPDGVQPIVAELLRGMEGIQGWRFFVDHDIYKNHYRVRSFLQSLDYPSHFLSIQYGEFTGELNKMLRGQWNLSLERVPDFAFAMGAENPLEVTRQRLRFPETSIPIEDNAVLVAPLSNWANAAYNVNTRYREFWDELILRLTQRGYSVYINGRNRGMVAEASGPVRLLDCSISELAAVAHRFDRIYAMRSGLCDLLALSGIPHDIIMPKVMERITIYLSDYGCRHHFMDPEDAGMARQLIEQLVP